MSSSRAIAAKNVWNSQFADWINDQDATAISLGEPDGNVEYDIAISREKAFQRRGASVSMLRESKFNQQRRWLKSGNNLADWSDGPFHLGNEIVMAAWMCGESGYEAITFFDVAAEDFVSSRNDRRLFIKAMKKIVEEFEIAIRYTDTNSSLFPLVGRPETVGNEDTAVDPTPIPDASKLFANRHSKVRITEGEILSVENGTVVISGGNVAEKRFEVCKTARENVSASRIVIPSMSKQKAITETVRLHGNDKEIYIFSNEVFDHIKRLKVKFGAQDLSPTALGMLGFAIGSSFDYIKTSGALEEASANEARLLRSIAKGKNIRHV